MKKRNQDLDFDDFEDSPTNSEDIDDFEQSFLNEDFDNQQFDTGGVPPMEKHNDLLKGLTNFDPYIQSKVRGWLGISWNEERSRYEPDPNIKPIMNAKCALWLIDFLRTYARSNNIITNISKMEYNWIMTDIVRTIWFNIGTRMEEFGIKNNGDVIRICNEIQHSAELVLMGAGDGKYNEFLSTTVSRSENVSHSGEERHSRGGDNYSYAPQRRKKGFIENLTNKLRKSL